LQTRIRAISLHHVIAIAIFTALALITLRTFLVGDSFLIYRDLKWPFLDIDEALNSLLYSTDIESTRRIIYMGPYFLAAKALGLSSLMAEKGLFLIIRIFTGLFAYLATYKFISCKTANTNKATLFSVSLFAGFFYSYNPAATSMISTTVAFAFSYSLIPLAFYFFDKGLHETTSRNLHHIFAAAALITLVIAGTTQMLLLLPVFLLLPWLAAVCIIRKREQKSPILPIKNSLVILILSVGLSSYWIAEAVFIATQGVSLEPNYVVTLDFLQVLSRDTGLENVIRLMGDWFPRVALTPIIDPALWTALSFAIPASAIVLVILSRHSTLRFYVGAFAAISVVVIFFNKGTQPPLEGLYPLLYDIPFIGWMFRVPSKFAIILPFLFMMIFSLGFYDLFSRRRKDGLRKHLVPPHLRSAILAGLIMSISLVSWPIFSGDFGGVYVNGQYPEKRGEGAKTELLPSSLIDRSSMSILDNKYQSRMAIANEGIAVVGGIDKLVSLNTIDPFNSGNSNLIFSDQSIEENVLQELHGIGKIVLNDREDLAMHFLPEDGSVIVKPSDATKRHNPALVWSIGGTNDPAQGGFHKYLDKFQMSNSELDYGEGLVFTWAADKLKIPFKTPADSNYDIYIRYLENEEGGAVKFRLDENPLKMISTINEHNKFKWEKIAQAISLTSGEHTFTIENIRGFNAVNLLILIESEKIEDMIQESHKLVANSTLMSILEAESDFVSLGKNNGQEPLFSSNGAAPGTSFSLSEDNGTRYYSRQIRIPGNTTHLSLQLDTTDDGASSVPTGSYYDMKSFDIIPLNGKVNELEASFENSSQNGAESTPKRVGENADGFWNWLLTYGPEDSAIISYETRNPIEGSKSLRFDISGASDRWAFLSTRKMLLDEGAGSLNITFSLNAREVVSLHSKVVFFDEAGNRLSNAFVSQARSGNFQDTYMKALQIPENARHFMLQFWLKPNPERESSYLIIDGITVQHIFPDKELHNAFEIFGSSRIVQDQLIEVDTDHVSIITTKSNDTNAYANLNAIRHNIINPYITKVKDASNNVGGELHGNVIESKPIRVSPNLFYRISMAIEEKNETADTSRLSAPLSARIVYHTENTAESSNYGLQKGFLTLEPGAELSSNVDIIKSSNYTVATRVMTCQQCGELTVRIGAEPMKVFSLKSEDAGGLRWLYLNTSLGQGSHNIRISANKTTDLDKVIIYSDDTVGNEGDIMRIENLFSSSGDMHTAPLVLAAKKVNPAQYELSITADKAPLLIKFPEPFHPMWKMYVNETTRYDPIQIYSEDIDKTLRVVSANYPAATGFAIEKVGNMHISVKFEPLDWFHKGAYLSIITLVVTVSYLIAQYERNGRKIFWRFRRRLSVRG
jgi:hypothetical protein